MPSAKARTAITAMPTSQHFPQQAPALDVFALKSELIWKEDVLDFNGNIYDQSSSPLMAGDNSGGGDVIL
jgi:hypothetical protein